MSSIRCSECGQRVVFPVWWGGKAYCTTCAIKKRAKEHIEEIRRKKANTLQI